MKNRNKPSARKLLSVKIQEIPDAHPDNSNYGIERMQTALDQKGIHVSRRTIYRAMTEMGIVHKKRTPRGITKATTEIQDRENLIKRDFSAEKPLQKIGLRQSLSGTGHCFDNARMESFFATLKKEKIYRISAYKLTREQVKTIIFRYIFVYYNRIRITSFNLGGLPPVAYREWAS